MILGHENVDFTRKGVTGWILQSLIKVIFKRERERQTDREREREREIVPEVRHIR